MTRFLAIFLLFILLTSCSEDYLFKVEKNFEDKVWTWEDAFNFEFEIKDSLARYDFEVELVHSPDFEYQNLYVEIATVFPNGKEISDITSFELQEGGAWKANCGSTCKLNFYLHENARAKPGKYKMRLKQDTRVNELQGIASIRFGIKNVSKD